MEDVVARVHTALGTRNLQDFTDTLGLDHAAFASAFFGQRPFTSLQLAVVAEATGTDIDWLLGVSH